MLRWLQPCFWLVVDPSIAVSCLYRHDLDSTDNDLQLPFTTQRCTAVCGVLSLSLYISQSLFPACHWALGKVSLPYCHGFRDSHDYVHFTWFLHCNLSPPITPFHPSLQISLPSRPPPKAGAPSHPG